ncbi:MAG: FemAB family XrtA/PEP-CTERM system-associated protein [Gammaproteobacteria bacterium]
MAIAEAGAADAARWDAYVGSHPDGSFFHRFGWHGVFADALGHRPYYLMDVEDGELRGVLPLVYMRSIVFGRTLSSLPFATFAGPLADDAPAQARLEERAHELAETLGVGHLEYRLRAPGGRDRPCKDLYEVFTKPVEPDDEANMKAIRSKQRNVIRKGIKNGLTAELGEVSGFYPVYAESVRNLGTPVFPRRLFEAIVSTFGDDVEILNAALDGRIVSSAMSFYHGDSVCPYYWGGVYEARRVNGNDYLAWELIRRASARGVSVFDFGRSKKGTGSHKWKLNLGFEPSPLYYEYDLVRDAAVPDVNPLNPKYRLFIEGWKRLPLPVATALGPLLSRTLG